MNSMSSADRAPLAALPHEFDAALLAKFYRSMYATFELRAPRALICRFVFTDVNMHVIVTSAVLAPGCWTIAFPSGFRVASTGKNSIKNFKTQTPFLNSNLSLCERLLQPIWRISPLHRCRWVRDTFALTSLRVYGFEFAYGAARLWTRTRAFGRKAGWRGCFSRCT